MDFSSEVNLEHFGMSCLVLVTDSHDLADCLAPKHAARSKT